jgi:hypothetical protein
MPEGQPHPNLRSTRTRLRTVGSRSFSARSDRAPLSWPPCSALTVTSQHRRSSSCFATRTPTRGATHRVRFSSTRARGSSWKHSALDAPKTTYERYPSITRSHERRHIYAPPIGARPIMARAAAIRALTRVQATSYLRGRRIESYGPRAISHAGRLHRWPHVRLAASAPQPC